MRFRKSSPMTKIIVIVPAIAAAITLVTLQAQLAEKEAKAAELEVQVSEAMQENQRLQDAIDLADTDEGIKAIAREKLGLTEDGEIVFFDIGS